MAQMKRFLDYIVEELQDIKETVEGMDCTFFACPGPGEPFLPMATCGRCYILHRLRNLLEQVNE